MSMLSVLTYDILNKTVLTIDTLITTSKTFCVDEFAVYSYMAQGAAIVAHLPYVPITLLGISYMSPEMCWTLDPSINAYANDNRLFLWVQFVLQSLTTVGSVNPDIVWIREISAALSLIMFYNFFNLTTPSSYKNSIDSYKLSYIIAICIFGLFSIEYIPVMLSCFIVAVSLECAVPGAFELLTPDGRITLLYCLAVSSAVMLAESVNFSESMELGFNLIFWQVFGSVVDVIILSPRPGRFITAD